eukprot:COSAG02_NODE_49642_length_325_cov_1.128319_1_plen_37_part_01
MTGSCVIERNPLDDDATIVEFLTVGQEGVKPQAVAST